MENTLRQHATPDEPAQWKTQEYHGRQIHVCTAPRTVDNEELAGHGQQWTFKVRVTGNGEGTPEDECARAESDREIFYSTQSIAEDLGFVRGRELIEGM
ncbi:MAG: hypothetical protein Q7J47_04260 [Azoarcus sp.]|nr:hypothetical protein [Azoarcus sp.]